MKLSESDAIAQYIAESGPAAAQLMGSTPAERATIRQWICFAQGDILDHVTQLALWRMNFKPYNEATEKHALSQLERGLAVVEAHMKDRSWLAGGDKVSMADISLASALVWGVSMIIDAEMRKKYPVVIAWFERTLAVDGIKEAFGEKKYIEKRKEYEG